MGQERFTLEIKVPLTRKRPHSTWIHSSEYMWSQILHYILWIAYNFKLAPNASYVVSIGVASQPSIQCQCDSSSSGNYCPGLRIHCTFRFWHLLYISCWPIIYNVFRQCKPSDEDDISNLSMLIRTVLFICSSILMFAMQDVTLIQECLSNTVISWGQSCNMLSFKISSKHVLNCFLFLLRRIAPIQLPVGFLVLAWLWKGEASWLSMIQQLLSPLR